jgi:tubulin gamma
MFHTTDGRKVLENLDEFDDAREVVEALSKEYEACESPDYIERSAGAAAPPLSAAGDHRLPPVVAAG